MIMSRQKTDQLIFDKITNYKALEKIANIAYLGKLVSQERPEIDIA